MNNINYKWLLEYFLRSDLTKKELYVFARLIYKNDIIFIDTKKQIKELIKDNGLKIKPENFYKMINKFQKIGIVKKDFIENKKVLVLFKNNEMK